MTDEPRVIAFYEDLVDDALDRETASLIMGLDRYYTAPAIEAKRRHSMREAVIGRHRQLSRLRHPKRATDTTRSFAWPASSVVTIVLVLALVAGSALAIAPRLRHALDMDPGAKHVVQSEMGVSLGQSQAIGAYVVTIDRVYADANRVVLGYSVEGPTNPGFNQLVGATLSDNAGHALPQRGGLGAGDGDRHGEYLEWFDASGVSGEPNEITLHLSIEAIRVMEWIGPSPQPSETDTADQGPPVSGSMIVDQIPANGVSGSYRYTTIPGPLTFQFTVPFEPAREAALHLAPIEGPSDLLLERISVSPSETRLYFSGFDVRDAAIQVRVGTWDSLQDTKVLVANWTTDEGLTAVSFTAPLYDERGVWRVVVTPHHSSSPSSVFEFQLPYQLP